MRSFIQLWSPPTEDETGKEKRPETAQPPTLDPFVRIPKNIFGQSLI